jgi:hypothetical protein
MTGRNRGRRAKWLRVAFVVTAAIAAHALGGGSAQAAPVHAGSDMLAGATSQHFPVFFKVSSDGKKILNDGIAVSMTCMSGGTLVWPDTFGRLAVRSNGTVHGGYASPTILTNGTASSVKDALTARLSPNHSQLTGTWQLSVNFTFSDGTTDHCDSGPVRFSATA